MTTVWVLLILGLNLPSKITSTAKVFKTKKACYKIKQKYIETYEKDYKTLIINCNKEKVNK